MVSTALSGPTLEQFQDLVAQGAVHYFIGGRGGPGGGGSASRIEAWVGANFENITSDGVMLYDLSSGAGRRQRERLKCRERSGGFPTVLVVKHDAR